MKTFKTEKGNIPEGATHYINESCVHRFSWGKYMGDDLHLRLIDDEGWTCVVNKFFSGVVDEIPQEENQMNIDKVETKTEHQEEMSAFSGEVEWSDKDEVPPVSWRGLAAYTEEDCDDWCDFHDGVVMGVNGDYVWMAHHGKFQRVHHVGSIEFKEPETPQQREDRERLEAAYDLYLIDFKKSSSESFNYSQFINDNYMCNFWLAIVDKTNYRKGVK